jgi:hypothetical protein
MNATITKIYGATKSAKDGNIYLACSATMKSGESVLGEGVESQALVNLQMTSINETIQSLLAVDPDNENRFRAIDVKAQELDFPVTLRNVRAHAEKENTFWATV